MADQLAWIIFRGTSPAVRWLICGEPSKLDGDRQVMHRDQLAGEEMLSAAMAALAAPGDQLLAALDRIPAAIYITDCDGVITHYNKACIVLAGRTPVARHDRWCVTWKLFTAEGAPLPHNQCPMAVAIRERRKVRGVEAIAERPDGTRISFVPYPTPLLNGEGELIGAVNLLIDITQQRHIAALRARAMQCRRLAAGIGDQRTADTLKQMATEFDDQARQAERPN
jgi:PAS domain-containing protein